MTSPGLFGNDKSCVFIASYLFTIEFMVCSISLTASMTCMTCLIIAKACPKGESSVTDVDCSEGKQFLVNVIGGLTPVFQ